MLEASTSAAPIPAWVRPNPWNPLVSFGRYWQWSVPTGIVLASMVAIATLQSFVPRYRASHLLERNVEYILFPQVQNLAAIDLIKERTLLFSAEVLDPILADPKVQTAPSLSDPSCAEVNLRKNLSIEFAGTNTRMMVCYQDLDPDAAALVCNAVVDSYLRQRDANEKNRMDTLTHWLEPEVQHWESKVEQRRDELEKLSKMLQGVQANREAEMYWNSQYALISQLLPRTSETTVQIALLNARLHQNEHLIKMKSTEVDSLADPMRGRLAKEIERERDLLVVELQDLNKKIADEQSRLERQGHPRQYLHTAADKLQTATGVLKKLRSKVAWIRIVNFRPSLVTMAAATPPRQPINSPLTRIATSSGVAFLSPLMLGFLLGFKRDTENSHNEAGRQN